MPIQLYLQLRIITQTLGENLRHLLSIVMELFEDISIKPYNSFGIQAQSQWLVNIKSFLELKHFLESEWNHYSRKLILGGGSNVLFTRDYRGLILRPIIKGIEIVEENEKDVYVRAMCGENWDEFVAVRHCFKLRLFQVRSKCNSCIGINFDQHELVREVVTKVGKVSDSRCNFCKVTDSYRSIDSELVRFEKNPFFLQPSKKIAFLALELDFTQAAVAVDMTADADMHRFCLFAAGVRYFEVSFEFGFACRQHLGLKNELVIVGEGLQNQGWFIFEHRSKERVHSLNRVKFRRRRRSWEKRA